MTADPLRELLRECSDELKNWSGMTVRKGLAERIDAALAQQECEPPCPACPGVPYPCKQALSQPKLTDIDDFVAELEKDPDMRERIAAARAWIRPALSQQPEPVLVGLVCGSDSKHGFFGVLDHAFTMPAGKFNVYAAPPSAAALIEERDKEIAELKVGMKVLLNSNSATAQLLKEKDAEIERLKRKEDAADMCLQSVSEARRVIKEHLGANLAFLDDDLVRWVAKWQERTESAETRVGELEEKLAVLLAIQRIRIESAEESIALLRETRKKIPTPSQFIRVPDGKPFEPGPNGIQDIWGREPKVGESAGYQDVSYLPGNWSGKSTWRVQHMKWADNPEYAKAMELFARIDLLLSRDSETAPASPDPATAIPGQ
jgi:hypothetical protein